MGDQERAARRYAFADAAAAIAEMERLHAEPYATGYRKAKERILAMIVEDSRPDEAGQE